MYSDTVSDFLTRVRNATVASKGEKRAVSIRSNKLVEQIANILKTHKFLLSVNKEDSGLEVVINPENPINHLRRLSKPGLRRYVKYTEIPTVRSGFGFVIISTPKGVMSGNQAKKQKVGGELICEVW